jgi:putative endonuclease
MTRQYYIYVMASISRVLYVGVTNDLRRRVQEHKAGEILGFTKRYNVNRLVYFAATGEARVALEREKQIKSWRRSKKIQLIERENPGWRDLSLEWDWPEVGAG